MKYICLQCGHEWDRNTSAIYLQCPIPVCRSRDVAPASFWRMVETARRLGINDNTPIQDIINGFKAVRIEESLLALGLQEFRRVITRVVREVEHPRPTRRLALEP